MKRSGLTILTRVVALFLVASSAAAQNNPTTNKIDAETLHALMALERQANEASAKGDSKFFDSILSEKFVTRQGRERLNKAALLKIIADVRCDFKTWNLDEPRMTKIDNDVYVLSYRGTYDGTCAERNGEPSKIRELTRAATVWVRNGEKWQAAFHGENLIVDPKNQNAVPVLGPAGKDIKPRIDPDTAVLAALERSVWKAWMARDRKKLENLTADSLSFVDIFGNAYSDKTDIIKAWSGNACKVKSVKVTDALAFELTPSLKLLTHIGSANGTCYGQKIGAIYGNSVYVKTAGVWKLAFTMNMPAM